MNILILNNEYPPLGGGAGVVSRYHAEGLAKKGHQVTVLTTWIEGEEKVEKTGNLTVVKLKVGRQKVFQSGPIEFLKWMRAAKKYLSQLEKLNYDISMSHYLLPSGDVSLFLKKKFNIPYVCMSHGHDVPFVFPKQMLKFHLATYFWLRKIASNAKVFLLLSEWMKNNADRFLGKKSTINRILHNGCDTDFFGPDETKKSEKFKILFVGRIVEQKNPQLLLNAAYEFSKKTSDFELVVLGDGPMRSKMESFCKEKGLSQVIFKGWVTKEEMKEHYQSAHMQLIASRFEGMSIAALESLSCGVYVLTTPVSGFSDMITEGVNGDFISDENPTAIASKIQGVYEERFLKGEQVNSQFLSDFRQQFHWSHIVDEVEEILHGVIASND